MGIVTGVHLPTTSRGPVREGRELGPALKVSLPLQGTPV